jgi:hypothetical protein
MKLQMDTATDEAHLEHDPNLISGKTLVLPQNLLHFFSYKIFGIARLIGRLRNCRRYGETESLQNNHYCPRQGVCLERPVSQESRARSAVSGKAGNAKA